MASTAHVRKRQVNIAKNGFSIPMLLRQRSRIQWKNTCALEMQLVLQGRNLPLFDTKYDAEN